MKKIIAIICIFTALSGFGYFAYSQYVIETKIVELQTEKQRMMQYLIDNHDYIVGEVSSWNEFDEVIKNKNVVLAENLAFHYFESNIVPVDARMYAIFITNYVDNEPVPIHLIRYDDFAVAHDEYMTGSFPMSAQQLARYGHTQ